MAYGVWLCAILLFCPMSEGKARALIAWSSGKDSAWAFYRAQKHFDIEGMLTTLTKPYERISMHGVHETILDRQAAAIGLPCHKVWLPTSPCSNEVYEQVMEEALLPLKASGITHVIFGDLFLADIRAYRERQMAKIDLAPVFPLWGEETTALAKTMIDGGLRAVAVCINPKKLSPNFAGRMFDKSFIKDLPPDIDPCGENGEFHTAVIDAPFYKAPIEVKVSEGIERDGFVFSDVTPI